MSDHEKADVIKVDPSDVMLLTFDDAPAEGYGAPEDVPAEAIDAVLDAIANRRFSLSLIEPMALVLAYFWTKLAAGGFPRFAPRGATYTGAEVAAELEAYRDGRPTEAVPVGVILQFLSLVLRLIRR